MANAEGRQASPALPWLLWDGSCGFCCWWVAWVWARGAGAHFRLEAYQRAPESLLPPEWRDRASRSVQLVFPERRLEGAPACLYVLGLLGHRTMAGILSRPPLSWVVTAGYLMVASHRGALAHVFYRHPDRCRNLEETGRRQGILDA